MKFIKTYRTTFSIYNLKNLYHNSRNINIISFQLWYRDYDCYNVFSIRDINDKYYFKRLIRSFIK